ncbi:HAD-IA family hydrolase [Anaerovorax odorimutans]|uniref:HAD-IA family hydrolase n=1 Tax=Anaerovorax odorimutans TaxID=109327 RepID=A0ABT1RMR2_9FIRM|nr:HAD-IA family hydrolase [Anaerovorax odorimutans]MCQ4636485.1 HAD-IA family hydrolase [Anaerovorax odorimutans]
MSKIDTVLFDFDGTVMNTNEVIINSWQHTFKTLENREEDVEKIIETFGEPLQITMEKLFPNVPIEQSVEIYRSYHRDNFGELISLFPGMKELLAELKQRNYKTAMVTSRLRNTTQQGLEKYEIADYFDTVVTADDTDKHKPDPEPIHIALEKLDSAPERSIMLGDTMFDILCAKNAGVKSVLVSWAMAVTEEEKTGPNKPDYIIEKAEDLLDLI